MANQPARVDRPHRNRAHQHRRTLALNTTLVLIALGIIIAAIIAIMVWRPWEGGDPADDPAPPASAVAEAWVLDVPAAV